MNLRETGIDFQDDGVVMENLELFEKAPNETVREYAYRVLYENIMSLKLPRVRLCRNKSCQAY